MTRTLYRHSRGSGNPLRLAFLFMGVFLVAPAASAQVATGTPPFGSFSGSSFDIVDEADANFFFAIPMLNKAGRGMPFSYSIAYNSSVWVPYNSSGTAVWTPVPGWGWGGVTSASTGYVAYQVTQGSCIWPENGSGKWYYWTNYGYGNYYDPNGTPHSIGEIVTTWTKPVPCPGAPNYPNSWSGTLNDGSGYSVTVTATPSATVYPPSGLTINVPVATQGGNASITDTNGNSLVTTYSSGTGTTTFTDTLGMTALTVAPQSGSTSYMYTYTGPSGPATYEVNYSSYTVQTNFGCSGVAEYGPTQQYLVSSIHMPDGNIYSFSYEPNPVYSNYVTGRLEEVMLPSGGTIWYSYSGGYGGITCQDGSAATLTRTVTPFDGSPAGKWTYARTESNSTWTTTITDPNSNQTVITFDYPGLLGASYEEQRTVYNSSGTVMETVNTCYNGVSIPCVGTAVNLPITELAVTTALSTSSGGTVESETNTYYNNYGFVTKVDEYDFGSGGVGAFKRETMNCPYSFSNQYIQDRPQYKLVYSATGNPSNCSGSTGLVAETSYTYDANGNVKTQTRTNTGGSPSSVSRSFNYGSYGVLTSATDFNSNTTTYGNFACASNTAFPGTITSGGLTTTLNWNCSGAVVASVEDPNSQTTTFGYDTTNNFWRLASTGYPDGGQTTISYNDSPSGFSVETSRLVSSGEYHQVTQSLDGLGRVYKSVDTQACSEVDTVYDSVGRVYTVSNPYCSTGSVVTQYGYDALSRVNSITYPDTSATSVSYSGNCSTATDPASKQRTACSDALGRTTSVTEDPNGLGYRTTYTYDLLNDLTGVAQGSSQTRTYSYDMLARLTGSKTPEVNVGGTQCSTTYGYDANGNLTSKVAPLTNQATSCTNTATTIYAYDALNRLTSKTYSDSTPPANFYYDQSSVTIGSWSSGTLGNPKGRMTEATTTSSGSVQTAVVYSYDKMGRTQDLWQCTPFNCGSSSIWEAQYSYDLAGDITSWVHPWPITFTNTFNSAQQITAIQSSWVDSNHPQYVAQSMSYTPWGALSTLVDGCAGSGCTNVQETYTYNNRLQPWMIELGTSSNASADYCLVYNYFSSWTPPSTCPSPSAVPTSGPANNGNVMGYWYQDSVNSSLSHTATYTYDNVNRISNAVATGNATYNLTFGYTADGSNGQYGNMTCVTNSQTNGPCANWTFNSSTNQLGTSQGFVYDAAGDLTTDVSGPTTRNYAWDAEGRLTQVTDNGGNTSRSYVYNALGQRVEIKTSGGQLEQVFDPQGERIAYYSVASGNNQWLYAYVPWRGRGLGRYNLTTEFDFFHANALGSATMATNLTTGAVIEDILFYPWGQEFNAPTLYDAHFAGLPASTLPNFADLSIRETRYRFYAPNPGRWHSPDPLGGDITNPQSLNRYAYVMSNPTTLTDPLGLQNGPPAMTCGHGFVVPFGQNPATWCYSHMADAGGIAAFFTNTADEFDLINLALAAANAGTYWYPCPNGDCGYKTQGIWIPRYSPAAIADLLNAITALSLNGTGGVYGKALGTLGQFFRGRPPGQSFAACVGQNMSLTFTGSPNSPISTTVTSGVAGIAGSALSLEVGAGGGQVSLSALLTIAVGSFTSLEQGQVVAAAFVANDVALGVAAIGLAPLVGSAANCASVGVAP